MDVNSEIVKRKESKISKQNHIIEEISDNGELQYNCTACNKSFRSRSQKYYHLNCNQLQQMLYKCDHCDKSFARQSQWKYHSESHISPINKCQKCPKTFSNPLALKKHVALHSAEPKLCPHCNKSFLKKDSLKQHIAAQHLNQLQYGCAYCSKKYASKSSLQLHLQSHEKKRFKCSYCGKLFQRNSILNLHLKRHYNSNNYVCTVCQKVFSESGALARHRKIHEENITQYHCKLCNKSILRKDNMIRHLNTIHPEEKFDNIVLIIKPETTKINEMTDTEVENKRNKNFVITENKLIEKSSLDNIEISVLNNPAICITKNMHSKIESVGYPINQIKVITTVPTCKNEVLTANFQNPSTTLQHNVIDHLSVIDSGTLENHFSITNKLSDEAISECSKFENVNEYENRTTKFSLNNCQSQSQTEKHTVLQNSHNKKEMQQNFCLSSSTTGKLMNASENQSNSNSNALQIKYKLGHYLPITQDEFENDCQPKTQTISSVIRSVGNVNKNLSSNTVMLNKATDQTNLEYKHKKYCRNNYNIHLYRKILGCDEEDEDQQQENSNCMPSNHLCNGTDNSMLKSPAPVHWRKSFKKNYETSAF